MSQPHRSEFRLLHRLRVRWAEIDLQRIVFNPHYLMYIDTAFTAYWRAMAMPYESIPALLGGDLYVKKSTLEYHGSAHLDDLLDIGVRCERVGNSSMGFRCGVFLRRDAAGQRRTGLCVCRPGCAKCQTGTTNSARDAAGL